MSRLAFGDALLLSPPGLGPLTAREADRLGLRAIPLARDRRADLLGIRRPRRVVHVLRTAEDVLVVAGAVPIQRSSAMTAAGLDVPRVVAAVRMIDGGGGRHGRRGFRVVVRLTDERAFLRTELRDALERRLGRLHNRADEADELWVIQTDRHTLHTGVRIREATRRTHRVIEREGALRPAIAAAMVLTAGSPVRVLDPCCGSGTIVGEVAAWDAFAVGGDIDAAAVRAAATNTRATFLNLDARRLPFATDSFDAVVTNLPFGHRYELPGAPVAWYRRTLAEAFRVAPTVVVLMPSTPPFRQALGRLPATLVERHEISVLGRRASIWSLHRR